jgi:phosphoglycolate phosphatase
VDVLLDLDGTLTDPAEGIVRCIRHALAAYGHPTPADAELTRFIGPPLLEGFAELVPEAGPEHHRALLERYRERFRRHGMFENRLYDGVRGALADLCDAGTRLHLATSKPLVYARRIVEHFDLGGFFESLHGSELDGVRSDKGELLAHLLEAQAIRTAGAAMVGDRRHDMIGARANGVRAIGVLWGYGTREELLAAGAEQLLDSVAQLPDILGGDRPARA